MDGKKPRGIFILGVFHLVLSLIQLPVLGLLIYMNIAGNLWKKSGMLVSLGTFWALMFCILGIIIAIGILRLKPLARKTFIILSVINIVLVPVAIIGYYFQENISMQTIIALPFSIIYSVLVIWYFHQDKIKNIFIRKQA